MTYFDFLAALGEGAAHPGGFQSTLQFLQEHPIPKSAQILEIGCGAGRTACQLALMGHAVTAIDQSPLMIEKAKARSADLDVHVDFQVMDASSMTFEDAHFDLIFVESVTLFMDIPTALKEYNRVLNNGGKLFDRELFLKQSHPRLPAIMKKLYGNTAIPSLPEWRQYIESSGFTHVTDWRFSREGKHPLRPDHIHYDQDPLQRVDSQLFHQPNILEFMQENQRFYETYWPYLDSAVFISEKP